MGKTLIHPSDKDGCGYYRIMQPATALSNYKPLNFMCSYHYYMVSDIRENDIDKVVIQRHTEPHMLTHLEFYKSLNLPIVHDIDDLLWQVPPTNPYHRYFKGINQKTLKASLLAVDKIVCSTEEMAQQTYKFVRKRGTVLPNYVSQVHSSLPKPRGNRKLRVGWAGSNTHVGDLRIISPVVAETLDKYDWVFMGYCDPEWQGKVEFHDFVPVQEYMTKMKSLELDVVLIPLEDNLFNHCKSHIKLLEFSTIGVPAITTEISPYRENPNYKIATSNKAWKHFKEALESWEDERLRMNAAFDAWRWSKKYCLEDNVDNIQRAWGL